MATGTPAFGSFGGGTFDVVNLGNLNVHFVIPIRHKAGRGTPFSYDLVYDSSIWAPVGSGGSQTWQPSNTAPANTPNSYWGWQGLSNSGASYISYLWGYQSSSQCGPPPSGSYYGWTYDNFIYHDQAGAHPFNVVGLYFVNNCSGTGNGPPNGTTYPLGQTAVAYDGSGFTITIGVGAGSDSVGASVTDKNGTLMNAPLVSGSSQQGSYSSTDSNGNEITATNGVYTDTLGQTALTVLGTQPNNTTLSYAAPSGATATYTVSYKAYTITTNFGCMGITEYNQTNVPLVNTITLPDGSSYQFGYEATAGGSSGQVTGRLTSVTLPTGGSITYSYPLTSAGHNAISCGDGSAPAVSGSPSLTRTVAGGTWQYTRALVSGTPGPGSMWTTTVLDPAGDQTVINFAEDNTVTSTSSGTYNLYETQRQVYQGSQSSGTLLLTAVTCYNGNQSNCTTTAVPSPISQTDVTLQYPNNGQQSKTETFYDTFGNTTSVNQYAYGTSGPGGLLRNTQITYQTLTENASIVEVPSVVNVVDGTSHLLASTYYYYDESAYPVQPTSGTPQHTGIGASRGNLTTITYFTSYTSQSGPNGTLSKHFQYYDTGTLYKSWDVNGSSTSYTSYAYGTSAQGNSTVSCGNSFPTAITSPPTPNAPSGLSTSYVWNCYGAVATSVTDANSNSVTTTYSDPSYWRPASTQDQLQNTTNLAYTAAGSSNPASVESKMLFNGNSSISEQLTTFDNLGRVQYSQQQEAPGSSNYDSTQIAYDTFGRPYQTSMPYVAGAGQSGSAAVTTTSYDALGRVTQVQDGGTGYVSYSYSQNDVLQTNGPAPSGENLKQKQLEYDALGRLTSVCEVTNATGSGTCGQNTALPSSRNTAYLTTYVYGPTTLNSIVYPSLTVTQNAQAAKSSQQTRLYVYDLLGRLIQETNPETGNLASGTTTYTFDSDSSNTCSGTYNGDLVKKVDNRGNTICYTYDSLHRVQSVTYTSGSPDYSITPAKTFVYDAATYNSTAMSNAMGHMAEAYTGSSSSKITDEFFSYSKRGELTDVYEYTPHSSTPYYHVTVAFWANGAVKSLAMASPSGTALPTETYGVDGKGRLYSVSASSGQNPVTSTSYNLSTYINTVTFGSGDSDVFTIDSNTGRLKKYQFNVGSNADTGTLNWNPNWSLGQLIINDTVPKTSDSQTCNYTHDDLARIASANCGSAWNQTFGYDPFGNITKNATVGTSFAPTYSTTTNQFTALSGITPTYDGDGRLTYDGVYNYTWDAESRLSTVSTSPSTAVTYDALGRMVETAVGTTYTEIVYSPLGKKFAVMSGQKLQKGFVPLPTGAKAIYTSSGLTYYRHHDHLGSSRLATTPSKTLYSSTAYAPFGEPYKQAGTTDLSFTGQDQDTASGMHDFLDRRYMPVQGRWLSPDPAGLAAVDLSSPQSWNRYAYVNNNPLALVDPFGDDCYTDISAQCTAPPGGTTGPPGAWTSGGSPTGLANRPGGPVGYQPGQDVAAGMAALVAYYENNPWGDTYVPPGDYFGSLYCSNTGGEDGGIVCTFGGGNSGDMDWGGGAGSNGPSAGGTGQCTGKIVNALYQVLGNFTATVIGYLDAGIGTATNVYVVATGLSASQFNALMPGARWSLGSGFAAQVLGLGPSLHIANPESWWDSSFAQFSNSNIGGALSVLFTVHIDDGNPNLPLGFFQHLFTDILGGNRPKC